jgi:hypothetical protein
MSDIVLTYILFSLGIGFVITVGLCFVFYGDWTVPRGGKHPTKARQLQAAAEQAAQHESYRDMTLFASESDRRR